MIEFIYCVAFILLWRMSGHYGDSLLEHLRWEKAKLLLLTDIKKQALEKGHVITYWQDCHGVWHLGTDLRY